MHIGSKIQITKPFVILTLVVSVILMVFLITTEYLQRDLRQQHEAAKRLTDIYGTEVKSAIENFESKWLSLDAHKNPKIQSELATGPYLDYWGFARKGQALYDEPFWLITKSANVTRVRVLEYSLERFKTVAHSVTMIDEITPAGKYKQSLPPHHRCSIYVFIRKDGAWKLAADFNADPRYAEKDWMNTPPSDWSRQILGDLPNQLLNDCEGYLAQ